MLLGYNHGELYILIMVHQELPIQPKHSRGAYCTLQSMGCVEHDMLQAIVPSKLPIVLWLTYV